MADSAPIQEQFQAILGRAATPSELQYLGKFMDEGHLQPQEIGQFLQSMPEFQQTQLNKNTQAYGAQLNEQNKAILDQAGAAANSRFASLGRPNTSAQGASVLQAGGQLAQQRQSLLADFYGRGLNQNQALGAQQGSYALQRGYGQRDEQKRRNWEIEDYYRQQNDFNTSQNARSGFKFLTPEFVANAGVKVAGMYAASKTGGAAGGGQETGAYPSGLGPSFDYNAANSYRR